MPLILSIDANFLKHPSKQLFLGSSDGRGFPCGRCQVQETHEEDQGEGHNRDGL